jgi:hypothetical protein
VGGGAAAAHPPRRADTTCKFFNALKRAP